MNRKKPPLKVSRKVLELFREKTGKKGKVKVKHETPLPIGYGLGLSGAGALSLAIGLNRLFSAKLAKKEVLAIAREAEIKCGTGLGDVVAEQYSGLMMGKKPYPSERVQRIKCREKFVVLGFLAPIDTKKIITSKRWKGKVNIAGEKAMKKLGKKKAMQEFIKCSREFAEESGLLTPRVRRLLEKMPGSAMAMLGETAFIPTNRPKEAEKILRRHCKKTFAAKISAKGAHAL